MGNTDSKQNAVGTQPDPGAVGTVPDPGAKPKKKLHAPTIVAFVGLGLIIAVAILLVASRWL